MTPGIDPPHRTRRMHPLQVRRAVVADVAHLGDRMRRVTFELEAGAVPVPFEPMAVGDHVKVAFPHPQTGELSLPTIVEDRPQLPEGVERPVTRDYTIRAVPDDRHVVLDMVAHGSGPGSWWTEQADIGHLVGLIGPRGSVIEPADASRYVVLGDETAIPAIERWLEEAPPHIEVVTVIQVPHERSIVGLPSRTATTVTWVVNDDESTLAEHLRAISPTVGAGDVIWAAGEAAAMLQVRRTAAQLAEADESVDTGAGMDLDLLPLSLQVDGYWRRGVAGRDHHAPLED